MRHFEQLGHSVTSRLFARVPEHVSSRTPRLDLAMALGAAIYVPGSRPDLGKALERCRSEGAMAAIVCLEDAVDDADVEAATSLLPAALADVDEHELPLVFVRVRSPRHLTAVAESLSQVRSSVAGYVAPKFGLANAHRWIDALMAEPLDGAYLMPILESPALLHLETRQTELLGIRDALFEVLDRVLCVRVGATDLCGLLGVRRGFEQTVYEVGPVRDCIAEIANVFCRTSDVLVSGPVWEYFAPAERTWKPTLRQSPFRRLPEATQIRSEVIDGYLDHLIREVRADAAHGLQGKSVIHPSHIHPVNALSAVTYEEHTDAEHILATGSTGGVHASAFANKMNESRPHHRWAEQVRLRSRFFGVLAPGVSFFDLLCA